MIEPSPLTQITWAPDHRIPRSDLRAHRRGRQKPIAPGRRWSGARGLRSASAAPPTSGAGRRRDDDRAWAPVPTAHEQGRHVHPSPGASCANRPLPRAAGTARATRAGRAPVQVRGAGAGSAVMVGCRRGRQHRHAATSADLSVIPVSMCTMRAWRELNQLAGGAVIENGRRPRSAGRPPAPHWRRGCRACPASPG